ncbi:Cytochrome c oxidase copper chaperone 1-like protein [Drosera capensis]
MSRSLDYTVRWVSVAIVFESETHVIALVLGFAHTTAMRQALLPAVVANEIASSDKRETGRAYLSVLFLWQKELADMGGLPLSTASSAVELPGQHQSQEPLTKATEPASKPKKKICCACPDTKRLRDECMVEHGEAACTKWIEAHKQCLRAEGFNV